MKSEPCNVCGSTDLNLIDGFYYCVECGTQDVNVRETVIEQTYLADGTLALVGGKKFSTIVKDGIQMSGEWHKWHAYNFILVGLTDELISLGAKPSVKMKVLWIWARYIKKFQIREDLEVKSKIGNESLGISRISQCSDSGNSEPEQEREVQKEKNRSEKFTRDIKIVTKGLLLAILYVALNLDKSEIQLSHLFRFIKEGRLSFLNCTKYVPKEIDTISIAHWKSFLLCQTEYNSHSIRAYAMTCIKSLDLGVPFVPDLKKIIKNYIKELCLPNDFKDLVFALMVYHPCNYLDIDKMTKNFLVRIPDYEGVAMSYVLVALKMCFGLDCDYEVRISDMVDIINYEENHPKSHKLGMYSEPTDRLFSFREWTRFLQFRKTVLCQHYLPMARQHNQEVDDYILMEHLEDRSKRPIKLRDEVIMDILNKIPNQNDLSLIPKTEFLASSTPMSTYTEVILNYILDDELRLLLSEDFTQYSLKYATELKFLDNDKYANNLIVGVSDSNKTVESAIKGIFESKKGDRSMVFVRNCENKNWLTTKPPAAEHITKISENEIFERESDHGYDSNIENTQVNNNVDINDAEDIKLECFEEENEDTNIFDDNFYDPFQDDKTIVEPTEPYIGTDDFNNSNIDVSESATTKFDIENFNKEKIIDELISMACKKYKITMPKEYVPREARKRKNKNMNTEDGESAPKRKRPVNVTKPSEAQMKVKEMITAYYNHIERDELAKVTEQVNRAIETLDNISGNVCNAAPYINHSNEEIENVFIHEAENTDHFIPEAESENSLQLNISEPFMHSDDINNTYDNDNNNETNYEESDPLNENIHDPNFDEKTHDIKQLYVKLKYDAVDEDFIHTADDPEVDRIILNKIEEFCNYDGIVNETKDVTNIEQDISDTDEDKLHIIEEQKLEEERKKYERNLEPLIKHPLHIKEFKYWLRHYSARSIGKNLDMHQKFDMELMKNYPPSFNFVIGECASILGCSTYSLYKCMQNLEEVIIAKSKRLRI